MNVVDDTGVETDMRVDDEGGGKDGVDDGLDKTGEERAMSAKCPVASSLVARCLSKLGLSVP